jgi:glycosyltransferase involved in cell wall biosynthesis
MRPTDLRLVIASTCLLDESSLEQLLPEAERARGDLSGGAWRSNDGKVLVLPNLNRPEFLAAMANALVVYYPTRYEGFGLPAIEAMALGVPLITGNTTSLPEIVGEAGVLVDPDSLESLTNALEFVSSDSDCRSGLIAKGLHRVTLFSRTVMAQGMVELFLTAASTR